MTMAEALILVAAVVQRAAAKAPVGAEAIHLRQVLAARYQSQALVVMAVNRSAHP